MWDKTFGVFNKVSVTQGKKMGQNCFGESDQRKIKQLTVICEPILYSG